MVKTNKTFSIEIEIYEEARRKGINLSEAAEMGIAQAVQMAIPDKIKKQTPIEKAQDAFEERPEFKSRFITALKEDTSFAKGWKNIILNETGIKLSQEETIQLFLKFKGGNVL